MAIVHESVAAVIRTRAAADPAAIAITGDGRQHTFGELDERSSRLAQAQAGHMPMLERRFNQIDVQHKGYITLQDIRAYRQQMRAARAGGGNPGGLPAPNQATNPSTFN